MSNTLNEAKMPSLSDKIDAEALVVEKEAKKEKKVEKKVVKKKK